MVTQTNIQKLTTTRRLWPFYEWLAFADLLVFLAGESIPGAEARTAALAFGTLPRLAFGDLESPGTLGDLGVV